MILNVIGILMTMLFNVQATRFVIGNRSGQTVTIALVALAAATLIVLSGGA